MRVVRRVDDGVVRTRMAFVLRPRFGKDRHMGDVFLIAGGDGRRGR
jgi:hypothetical protein